MKKITILVVVALLAVVGKSQPPNNAIFGGGDADGWNSVSHAQAAANAIFTGGAADGWSSTSFAQPTNNIYAGGISDGWSSAGFAQPINNIYAGGNSDGWASASFAQPTNNIYGGGIGDGWSVDTFAQPIYSIFGGGDGDGWSITNFAQPTYSIFTGGQGDGWANTYRPLGPLPIYLLSFNAKKQTSTSALIIWQTGFEINNAYFDVEASADAINFKKIGRVLSQGNSSTIVNYNFTDNNPVKGINYYRLKQVDVNGTTTYTEVKTVVFADIDPKTVLYYPNPTNGILTIEMAAVNANEVKLINIFNASGLLVQQLKIAAGLPIFKIDISKYSKGTYFIQLQTTTLNSTQRIIKQ
jgi:hypothetical protein